MRWTTRDKTLYAQPDAGAKDLERWVLKRDKTAYAQHDQRFRILQSTARDESAYAQHGRGVVEVGGSAGLMHASPAVMCLIFNETHLLPSMMQINTRVVPCCLGMTCSHWCVGHCAMPSTTKLLRWIGAWDT